MRHETIVYCDAQDEELSLSTCKSCELLKRQELDAGEYEKCIFFGGFVGAALKEKSVKFTEKQIKELEEIQEGDMDFDWLVRKAVNEFIKKNKIKQRARKQKDTFMA